MNYINNERIAIRKSIGVIRIDHPLPLRVVEHSARILQYSRANPSRQSKGTASPKGSQNNRATAGLTLFTRALRFRA
jgi:hypothetical protein